MSNAHQPQRFTLLAIMVLIACPAIFSDDLHYINLFIGDRAAGMGGAYTAIADGPEGAYYNPAGLAFSPSVYISVSNNAVQLKNLTYYDIWNDFDPTSNINYTRNSFSFVPNFFGTVQRAGKTGFALTMATIESESYDQRDKLTLPILWQPDELVPAVESELILNVSFINSTTNQEIGTSWGTLLNEDVSIGFGTFFGYRDTKMIFGNLQRIDGFDIFQDQSFYSRKQTLSLRPSLGLQWALNKTLTLGLSTTSNLPLFAWSTFQSTNLKADADGHDPGATLNTAMEIDVTDSSVAMTDIFSLGNLVGPTSLNSTAGLALFLSSSFLLDADFSFYVPLNDAYRVFTWNAASGMEWYLTPNFPLRLGLFTNNANTPVIPSGGMNYADHINLYGGSLSLGYATTNYDITLGVNASLGRGQSQILSDDPSIQTVDASTIQVFVAANFH